MLELKNKSDCSGCHSCYNICPVGAINMKVDDKGFKYPEIDKNKCINCGMCERVCPIINTNEGTHINDAYAIINNDEKIRLNSSSGGIFYLLANFILSQGGVVFGAAFDKDMTVHHIAISDSSELHKLMTSKYLQSSIGDSYKECKKDLEDGKLVLFTGTPCQIEGLYSFLQKDYDNIYTQDLVCHGAPSPKIRQMYLKFIEKNKGVKTDKANFRQKTSGWKRYSLSLNDNEYDERHQKDLYMKLFLSDFILRDSCYSCKFKKMNRMSDITLADFRGISNIDENFDDDKGTSLVILHSSKGKKLFEEIKKLCKYKKVDFNRSISFNPSYYESVKMPKNRENLFKEINVNNFDTTTKKYTGGPIRTMKGAINGICYTISHFMITLYKVFKSIMK